MWRYRRPGFEALLLAELQRQQQCSQLCDTVLRAGGISVPTHSCVLSTLSPQLSCTLSSSPSPPTGQTHLVEFQAVGACTLLQLVGLLYSGEMVGEGEEQRQEAISAAAKLGIHGLVEVRKGDGMDGREEGSQQREVGVQTAPLMCEGNGVGGGKWRREVRDGSTLLWKETLSNGERDTWTEMGEVDTSAAHPPHPAISVQTVDMAAVQSSGEPDLHLLPPRIPYVPLSLLYPADGSQALAHHPSSSVLMASTEESFAAEHTPIFVLSQSYSSGIPPPLPPSHVSAAVSSQVTQDPPQFATDPQSWWTGPQGAGREVVAAEGEDGEGFEQFMGNIPGFISYFLNPGQEEGYCGRRTGRRWGGRAGGARRAGTGERRARRPRARTRGRGRGATQTAEAEDVVVSGPQEDWLQRLGVQASRTGEGGGAAGRKLYLKTRELLQPIKICLKRRGRGEVWEISQSRGEALRHGERGGGNMQRGRKRSATPQLNQIQDGGVPVSKSQRGSAKSVFFSSSPMRLIQTYEAPLNTSDPSASTEPYVAPAPALLHTTPLPALPPPPQEDQNEQIERLLEEVMMGLDILPNNNNSALHPHPPTPTRPTSGTSCTYPSSGHAVVQQDQLQQCLTTGLQEAASDLHGSTEAVAIVTEVVGSCPVKGEVPVLQQPQGEGELSKILDHFLRSFEQQVPNCSARAEVEMDGQSYTQASLPQPYIMLRDYSEPQSHTSSTVQESPHLEHTCSTHPPQTITPPAHTPYPAVYTPPPPFLSPLTNRAEPPLALPPVCTVLPHNHGVVIKEREEKEETVLTRRQRRERTDTPVKASFVRLTELLEGEIVRPETPPSHSQPCTDSTPCAVTNVVSSSLPATSHHKQPKAPEKVRGPARPQAKRKKSQRPKQIRARKPACTSDTKTKSECKRGGMVAQQLQQVSVVTLERIDPLPGAEMDITRQGFKCESLEVMSPTESQAQNAKTSSLLMKGPPDKKHPIQWTRKNYPIRSRFREGNIMQSILLVEEPLSGNRQRPAGTQVVKGHLAQPMRMEENDLTGDGRDKLKKRRGPPGNKRLLLCLSKGESSMSPSQPQDVEHCGMDEQMDKNRDRHEVELAEACRPARRGEKRRIMAEEERNDAHVAKRVCLEQVAPSISEPCTPSSESAPSVSEPQDSTQDVRGEAAGEATITVDTGEEVDVEIISLLGSENDLLQTLVSEGDILQGGTKEEETWNKINLEETDENGERRESFMDEEMERSSEDVIVVDGDSGESIGVVESDADFSEEIKKDQRHQNLPNRERKTAALSHVGRAKPPMSPPSHSAIEVIPGSTGSWKEEEEEEEEVDVIGGSSPFHEPLPISLTEVLKSEDEEEEEEEEIDIIGGEMDYAPSTGILSSLLQTTNS